MAPRGRQRKVDQTQMGAAIDALTPMGFSKDLIMRKVKDLLKVYDGQWLFIEESSYSVLIEAIMEEQEECKKNDGDAASDCDDNDAEPSNAHDDAMSDVQDDTEPSCTRSGMEYRSTERTNDRDATFVPQAGRREWKDISCIPTLGSIATPTGVPGAAPDLHSRPRRKPCYGWIGSEEEEKEDCVYFETEASRGKKMRQGIDCQAAGMSSKEPVSSNTLQIYNCDPRSWLSVSNLH